MGSVDDLLICRDHEKRCFLSCDGENDGIMKMHGNLIFFMLPVPVAPASVLDKQENVLFLQRKLCSLD